MKLNKEKKGPSLQEILKHLEESKYHGNITIHFTHGKPRKIEYKKVETLDE